MDSKNIVPENPFVGLRPFESDESLMFFGRKDQTTQLLQRLYRTRFVAIVGGSGSGKSSLVRAGLIPSLKSGFLIESRSKWHISIMKPGESPIYNLASSITQQGTGANSNAEDIQKLYQKIRDEGVDAVAEAIRPIMDRETNYFILVDQFEEIFRFIVEQQTSEKIDEANEFVNLILDLTNQVELPVYLVITMRSDFIGDCVRFQSLPEALNNSQYLVPKLSRQELRNVIESPVKLFRGKINQRLTDHLLNSIQEQQDELPILQHLLMRIWEYEFTTDHSGDLDLSDYHGVKGLQGALSQHADEALAELNNEEQNIAKQLYQALTAVDESKRKVRRPARLSELTAITQQPEEKILSILNVFIKDNRTFLVLNKIEDSEDYLVDISHESLIRQWDQLSIWVDEEKNSADAYIMLADSLQLHNNNEKDYLSAKEVQRVENNLDFQKQTVIWAKRYGSEHYDEGLQYLNKSKRKVRQGRFLRVAVAVLVIATVALGLFYMYSEGLRQDAIREQQNAVLAMQEAKIQRDSAEMARARADTLTQEALHLKSLADVSADSARMERALALEASQEAQKQAALAETAKQEAIRQADLARKAMQIAEKNSREAEIFGTISNQQKMQFLAKYMAKQSQDIENPELRGLVAMQAYQFHREFSEDEIDADINSGLITANNAFWNQSLEWEGQEIVVDEMILANNSNNLFIKDLERIFKATYQKDGSYVLAKIADIEYFVSELIISPDDRFLLAIGLDYSKTNSKDLSKDQSLITIIDIDQQAKITVNTSGLITSTTFSPDGDKIYFADKYGRRLNKIDLNGENREALYEVDPGMNLTRISASPNFKLIAGSYSFSGGDNGLLIYDLEKKEESKYFDRKTGTLGLLALHTFTKFSPDGSQLAFSSNDGDLHIIDMSPDYIQSGYLGDTTIIASQISVTALDFDPSGNYLAAVVDSTSSVRIWNTNDFHKSPIEITFPEPFQRYSISEGGINFSADGSSIYVLANYKIKKIPANADQMNLCPLLSRNMTKQEWDTYVGDIPYEKTCPSLGGSEK